MRTNNSHSKSLFDWGQFVGWDGEGVTVKGKHRYILMMNSLGEELYEPKGITTRQAFEFILQGLGPNRIHVCFASGYDINKILRTMPKGTLNELWDPAQYNIEIVQWGKYSVRYRKAKNFWLADKRGSITLWDVFGFFQCSFVKALLTYFPEEANNPELQEIVRMKAQRSQFKLSEIKQIKYYCALELKWLVKLMDKLRSHFRRVNLKLSRWDGAGAVASCLLRRERIKQYQEQRIENIERALRAYYGGRIETTCIGFKKGRIYQYDLRSAYPSVIRVLPALKNGVWHKLETPGVTTLFSLHQIEWKFDDGLPFYPLPYRSKNDSILFPPSGKGWYWGSEVGSAIRFAKQLGGTITINQSYNFSPDVELQRNNPFAFVTELYEERAKLKRAKDGAEYVIKLGLNSLYGKFQQQLGGTVEKFPSFFQPEWSGFITACTRAKLLDAALCSPDNVLMFATDGVFTTRKLNVRLGDKLGEWEEQRHDGIIIIQPGVYYVIDGSDYTIKTRGFGIEPLRNHAPILNAWKKGKKYLPIPTTRFVTLGSALASEELWKEWGEWRTVDRELCLDGYNAKRNPVPAEVIRFASSGLVPTTARDARDYIYLDEESKPFATIWNQDGLDDELIDSVPYNVWLHETLTEEYLG